MIGAIAGLSDLGVSLALARVALAPARHANQVTRDLAHPTGIPQVGRSARDSDEATDTVEISPEGLAAARRQGVPETGESAEQNGREQLERLRKRDREVRMHEAAHQAAGGRYAGKATFTYQTGPDGRRYAVGGEVPIDISPVDGDPRATIRKMQQVRRAALAPAQPSGADRQVAARAARIEARARAELQGGRADSFDPFELSSARTDGARSVAASPGRNDSRAGIDVYA